MKLYYVYILASIQRVLYVGVTGTFEKRLTVHSLKLNPYSFAARYNCNRLVYFEEYTRAVDAIERETQVKKWRRSKKVALIEAMNPEWVDLGAAARPDSSLRSE